MLSKEFKPKSEAAQTAVQTAVRTLAEQALAGTALVGRDAVASIQAIIAELDRKLTEQVNVIIHHPDFQKLEGTWRGLHHLVNNTETDEKLKIRVMSLSKKEAGKVLKKFKGTLWGPEPDLQESLRRGVRHAGRFALRLSDRGLRVRSLSAGHRNAGWLCANRGGRAYAVYHRGGAEALQHG